MIPEVYVKAAGQLFPALTTSKNVHPERVSTPNTPKTNDGFDLSQII